MNNKAKVIIMMSAAVLLSNYTVYAFSDEYEPIYPQKTAVTRSVEDIYLRVTGAEIEKELPEEVISARKEVIQMYKNIGIDISYDMENVVSTKLRYNMPSRWSKKTPMPLEGDYAGPFSVDACWNNQIPEDAPMVEIPYNALSRKFQIGSLSTNIGGDGDGIGFPMVIGNSTMPYRNLVIQSGATIQQIYRLRMPENVVDYLNNRQTGDEHGIFIDAENNVAVESWKCRAIDDPRGFGNDLALPYAPVRGRFGSCLYSLDGIATEGRTGTNAASIPSLAFTIKPNDLQDDNSMINHALGAAFNVNLTARVMPAFSTDSHAAGDVKATGRGSDATYMKGIVPYGGIVRLDPEIDLKAIYDSGKLSWPGYKILKAMQDYGIYNIDTSGNARLLIYTSTHRKDWLRSDDEKFNVPFAEGKQGQLNVSSEVAAFVQGDEFFGIGTPKLYCTVPVMKYAELDVNGDGAIDEKDYNEVASYSGKAYSETTKIYDVNQDKVHDYQDTEIMYRYLNDMSMHEYEMFSIIEQDSDNEHGKVVIGGSSYGPLDGNRSYKAGSRVHVSAFPNDGYEFAGWTGDLAGYEDDVVALTMDKEYVVGAKFRKLEEHKVTFKTVGGGKVEVRTAKDSKYQAPSDKYGEDVLLIIKPVPDEGWIFAGFEGDIKGFDSTASIIVDKELDITAMFVRDAYNEPFKKEEWKSVKGGSNVATVTEGKQIAFPTTNWSISEAVAISTNENIDLTGDYLLRAYMFTGYPLNNGAELVFNYKDNKNYYYFKIGGYGTGATLGKVYKGFNTELAKYEGKTEVGGVLFDGFPITIGVQRKNGKFSAYGYKNGGKITYFEDVRDKTHDGGTLGVGALYNGVLKVSTIVVQKELPDLKEAVIQEPGKTEEKVEAAE